MQTKFDSLKATLWQCWQVNLDDPSFLSDRNMIVTVKLQNTKRHNIILIVNLLIKGHGQFYIQKYKLKINSIAQWPTSLNFQHHQLSLISLETKPGLN